MESISNITPTIATAIAAERNKTFKPTTAIATVGSEELFGNLHDLVNEQFKAWYCGRFNRLGCAKVMALANQSRKSGKDSRKMFSYLLKVYS
jgi:hypothetical protein